MAQKAADPFLHGIQTIRGIFAVLVVCPYVGGESSRYWSDEWLDSMFNHSTFRANFFFVPSGFVFWAAHRADAGGRDATRRLFLRRSSRLYPLLVTLSLLEMLLIWFIPGRAENSYQVIPSLLALPHSSFPVIVSALTLSFEVFFILMPSLLAALPKRWSLPAVVRCWEYVLPSRVLVS